MTREQLDELNAGAVRRHFRAIADRDGRIPQQLLDDLASIAEQHATMAVGEAMASTRTRKTRNPERTGE